MKDPTYTPPLPPLEVLIREDERDIVKSLTMAFLLMVIKCMNQWDGHCRVMMVIIIITFFSIEDEEENEDMVNIGMSDNNEGG